MFKKAHKPPYTILEIAQLTKDIEKHMDLRNRTGNTTEHNNESTIIDVAQKTLQFMLEANERAIKR